jgi:NAD(P)H-flavin reductase
MNSLHPTPIHEALAKVGNIRILSPDIAEVILSLNHPLLGASGQYLLIIKDGKPAYFSVAKGWNSLEIELHIRTPFPAFSASGQRLADEIPNFLTFLEQIQAQKKNLILQGPLGLCHLGRCTPNAPLLLVASSTGFAQMKSMIQEALIQNRPVHFFWGGRSVSDLYDLNLIQTWLKNYPHFVFWGACETGFMDSEIKDFTLMKSTLASRCSFSKGTLAEALTTAAKEFSWPQDIRVFLSGSSTMVEYTVATLIQLGFDASSCFSDWFDLKNV